ncbi:tol-pal system-associated acyl-CoA thioesterase [Ectothiorhodospiraceae bacterium 2226]|nr:tol-pal system-associated acyl-CoA thioesterase [Ectothiorhodospiraceae bacterium 2226]
MTEFLWPVRVYYEDTDSGGVVYYANYLRFMERARTEWLRSLGFEQDELLVRDSVLFAVRSAQVDYLKPARFNDLLTVRTSLQRRGRASLTFKQNIVRNSDDALVCTATVKIANLNAATLRPVPMAPRILASIPEDVNP